MKRFLAFSIAANVIFFAVAASAQTKPPLRLLHGGEDVPQVLEAVAECGPLPGRCLQQHADAEAGAAPVGLVERRGHAVEAGRLAVA